MTFNILAKCPAQDVDLLHMTVGNQRHTPCPFVTASCPAGSITSLCSPGCTYLVSSALGSGWRKADGPVLPVLQFGLVHISVGDLLRAEVEAGTPAGQKAQQFMDAGNLVPNEVVVEMVTNRLSEADVREHGWLLDGYPRSGDQADAIEEQGIRPDVFILITVSIGAASGGVRETAGWCLKQQCITGGGGSSASQVVGAAVHRRWWVQQCTGRAFISQAFTGHLCV